jgi:hypothetical protein
MNNDLFSLISSGNVKESLLVTTRYILLNNSFDELENIFVSICAYIGTFINLYDISKLLDVYAHTKKVIESESIVVKDIYVLISKFCILCDSYNKHSVSKCGTMTMKLLKEKVAFAFQNEDMKLSSNGIRRFDGVLPPQDNENYAIALRIIAILIKTIKLTDDIPYEQADKLNDIANKLRYIMDFVTRGKYKFETKFYASDNDSAWFIWGILSILYNEPFVADAFWLYNINFKKTYKNKRIGLLWSMGLAVIYSHKKNVSQGWNEKESNIINKIDDIAINLYNEIKKKIISENPTHFETQKPKKTERTDGLNILLNYTPFLGTIDRTYNKAEENATQPIRLISF